MSSADDTLLLTEVGEGEEVTLEIVSPGVLADQASEGPINPPGQYNATLRDLLFARSLVGSMVTQNGQTIDTQLIRLSASAFLRSLARFFSQLAIIYYTVHQSDDPDRTLASTAVLYPIQLITLSVYRAVTFYVNSHMNRAYTRFRRALEMNHIGDANRYRAEVREFAQAGMLIASVFGVTLSIALHFGVSPFLRLLGQSDSEIEDASGFYQYFSLGVFFAAYVTLFDRIVTGVRNEVVPPIVAVFRSGVETSVALAVVPAMGLAGYGLAYSVSAVLMSILLGIFIRLWYSSNHNDRNFNFLSFSSLHIRNILSRATTLLRGGRWLILQIMAENWTSFFIVMILGTLSPTALSAFSIAGQANYVLANFINALAAAVLQVISAHTTQEFGHLRWGISLRGMMYGFIISAVGLVLALVPFIRDGFIHLYTDNEKVIHLARYLLPIYTGVMPATRTLLDLGARALVASSDTVYPALTHVGMMPIATLGASFAVTRFIRDDWVAILILLIQVSCILVGGLILLPRWYTVSHRPISLPRRAQDELPLIAQADGFSSEGYDEEQQEVVAACLSSVSAIDDGGEEDACLLERLSHHLPY